MEKKVCRVIPIVSIIYYILFDQNKIKPHEKLKDYILEIADGGISEIMLTIDVNSDSNHLGERTCKGGTITNCKEIKIIEF